VVERETEGTERRLPVKAQVPARDLSEELAGTGTPTQACPRVSKRGSEKEGETILPLSVAAHLLVKYKILFCSF
jgi:hypothetical protein